MLFKNGSEHTKYHYELEHGGNIREVALVI
jgi:hypothetical protein